MCVSVHNTFYTCVVSFQCVAHVMRLHVLLYVSIRFVKPMVELLQVKQLKQFRNCFKFVRIIPLNMIMFSFIWQSFTVIFLHLSSWWQPFCQKERGRRRRNREEHLEMTLFNLTKKIPFICTWTHCIKICCHDYCLYPQKWRIFTFWKCLAWLMFRLNE